MTARLADLDWPVRTERLALRPVEPRDALPTFAFRSRPEVAHWLGNHPQDRDAWVAGFAERSARTLVVELAGPPTRVIGDLYLNVHDPWSQVEVHEQAAGTQAEIGYSLDPAYVGLGYATEAVREELRICFERLGLRRVIAQCFAENEPSWRLMERLGMRREQLSIKDSLHRDGTWRDGMLYALLAEEWSAGRLEP